mmetsp:Transcript_47955/g.74903  ORF Transcript_47955/g.74903 Transcript_47955/m.74903 type:complete len:143 (-) Transcript_47955:291-719(-)
MLVVGGGGYVIRNVSRCWVWETAVLTESEVSNDLPWNEYWDYFAPSHQLHCDLRSKGMPYVKNRNTAQYLDGIRKQVFENLRHLQGAPSVQMQELPPTILMDLDSEDEDTLTDEQKRVRDLERSIEHPAEFLPGPEFLRTDS